MRDTRKLSWIRVFLAICLLVGIGYGVTIGFRDWKALRSLASFEPWFAPYVDVTSTPTFAFEQSNSDAVLAFIVSSPADACTATWGAVYTLDEAGNILDLDRRIAKLQQHDGKIAVSFGGALNDELAINCTDSEKLLVAYESVISRYHVDTIDLDLEGAGLSNHEAGVRRAKAIAQLQTKRRNAGASLAIWLTLPVTPNGLTQDGTDVVDQMLNQGVDLSGVNAMTMDYANSLTAGQTMLTASKQALIETQRQLGVLYKRSGINLSQVVLWRKIGSTPMIGQNDVTDEIFSLTDAVGFNTFAHSKGVGRMSMWSANRDIPCGENYTDLRIVSDSCSGVKSDAKAFAKALGAGFDGDLMQNAKIVTTVDPKDNTQLEDNPIFSPYQIWQEIGAYPQGAKVVWHHNVYQAKWWTKGDLPDNPVLQAWETPWQFVGPVLPGDKPVAQATLPTGTYPKWSGSVEYSAGQRVLVNDIPFEAKWWNKGESPEASAANADNSPWLALTQTQIAEILKDPKKK